MNLDTCGNFDRSCRYNQAVQYRRDAAHKSRAAWAFRSLEVYMSENQHIYDVRHSSIVRLNFYQVHEFSIPAQIL